MHQAIQQRVDGAAALHVRSTIATAAFYALIGRNQLVQKIRYQIQTKGNAYHIIELSTGLTRGFRWTWRDAINFTQVLEARADGIKVSLNDERK